MVGADPDDDPWPLFFAVVRVFIDSHVLPGQGVDVIGGSFSRDGGDRSTNRYVSVGVLGIEDADPDAGIVADVPFFPAAARSIDEDTVVVTVDPYRGDVRRTIRHQCPEMRDGVSVEQVMGRGWNRRCRSGHTKGSVPNCKATSDCGNGFVQQYQYPTVYIERVPVTGSSQVPTGSTNAYLLGTAPSVLVDPAAHSDELDTVIDASRVEHIVVTHTHPDHVGAVSDYADRTNATVWAREGWTDRFVDATGVTPDATLGEGTELPGEAPITVHAFPGHAPDHIGLVVPTDDGTVAVIGDLAMASGSVAIGDADGDMRAYYTALRRIHAQDHDRLYPGHGPPIDHPRDQVAALLAHRRHRERRIESAVLDGVDTVPNLVEVVYEKDLTGVEALAEATVKAHLEKLVRERRITWDGGLEALTAPQ